MSWSLRIKKRVKKQVDKLPSGVSDAFFSLLLELKAHGPTRSNWKNYSKLSGNLYHCHIKKGRPTYVVVWELIDKEIKIIEVKYVGTHEKAPY